jgi:hypothetical protein
MTDYDASAHLSIPVKQNVVDPKKPLRQVWITGRRTIVMVAFYLMAVGLAIGHHLAYQHLDGKAVMNSQRWTNRFATAVAFAFKTCLTVSVGLAFQEALWAVVRQRFFKIGSLDKLFTVQSNPLSFLCWEAIIHGFSPLFLAGISWLLPIAVVFTPGTLTVRSSTMLSIQPCSPPIRINASDGMMWVDGCTSGGMNEGTCAGSGFGTIGLTLQKLSAQVITGGAVINAMVIPPLLDTLNYSYTINFDGPALKCEKQPFTSIQISYYLSYLAYEVK